jgi:hypothetical protein
VEILAEREGFRYQVMEQSHLEEVVDCTFNQFYNFEPMTQFLKPPPGRFRAWVRGIAEQALAERLSVVGVDTRTGEVAGLLLSDDYAASAPEGDVPPGIEPLLALLAALHDRYAALRPPFGPGEVFHHFILATWPRYQRMGVTQGVGVASAMVGYARGFQRTVCEVTSSVSQRFVLNFGHRKLDEIRYADFEHEGRRVFAGVDPTASCQLLEGTY